jgi:hypothetical protein
LVHVHTHAVVHALELGTNDIACPTPLRPKQRQNPVSSCQASRHDMWVWGGGWGVGEVRKDLPFPRLLDLGRSSCIVQGILQYADLKC